MNSDPLITTSSPAEPDDGVNDVISGNTGSTFVHVPQFQEAKPRSPASTTTV